MYNCVGCGGGEWGCFHVFGESSPGDPKTWGTVPDKEDRALARLPHMFIGQFEHNIDDKGRIAIPRKFRDQFTAGLVLTQSFDPCLWVFTMRGWETMADQFSGLSIFDTDARTALRIIFGSASDCQLDQQGRVVVPSYLRDYAHLKNDVVVVGASTIIEIWDRETWEQRKQVHQTEGAQIVQRLAAQGKS